MPNLQLKIPEIRAILTSFFIINIIMILFLGKGPSSDEGIYIIAGLELLDGLPDSYSSWHNGSPYMWSILSAFIFSIGSLTILRIFSVIIGTLILYLCFLHSQHFLERKDALLATLMIAIYGPFLSFIQVAVYDVLAFLFFMIACVLLPKKTYVSFIIAAFLAGLAIITKYAFIISFPLLLLYIFLIHDKKWILLTLIFSFISGFVVITHNYLVFDNLIPTSYNSYTDNSVKFSFNSLYSLGICFFMLLPFGINYLYAKQKVELQEKWYWFLLLGILLWPIFHIITGNPVSAQKHLVYGIVFSAPLLFFNFKRALLVNKILTLSVAFFLFLFQFLVLFNTGSDLDRANDVLQLQIKESSSIISNMGTYRTRFVLFKGMPKVSEQLKNYKQLSTIEKSEVAPVDFILWKETSDLELENWIMKQSPYYEKIDSYSDFFIGAADHLPWGFHIIEISIYKKNN